MPKEFKVEHQPDKVKINYKERKGGYLLTVTVPPGTAAGLVEDEIILKTDKPKASEVKIPVTILISNAGAG